MTEFKVKLSPKDEQGKQRILKFVASNPHLLLGGESHMNDDGSAEFTWQFMDIAKPLQEFARRNFIKQLDEAIIRKDNLTYEVLVG